MVYLNYIKSILDKFDINIVLYQNKTRFLYFMKIFVYKGQDKTHSHITLIEKIFS